MIIYLLTFLNQEILDGYQHGKRNRNYRPTTPLQVENILDLGYLGVKDYFPTVKYVLPFKKKRKSELR